MTLEAYLRRYDQIEGWLHMPTALMSHALSALQRRSGLKGSLIEIGVYHGKYFFAFSDASEKDELCIAVDLFEDQDRNDDLQGYNEVGSVGIHSLTRTTFEQHAQQLIPEQKLLVIQGSSLDLTPAQLMPDGQQARFFSIDGGHSAAVFKHDLLLAEQTIAEHGIVAVDDVLNPQWPGIITEVVRYLDGSPSLLPVAFVPNKLLMAKAPFVDTYKFFLRDQFPEALQRRDAEFSNFVVDQYRD